MRQLGKSVGRRSRRSIAFQAVKDHRIVKWLLIKIGKKIKKELISTASRSESMFKDSSISSIYSFDWAALSENFKKTNPMLSTLIEACIDSNRSAIRCPNKNVVLSVVAGILLRNCSQRCNLLQTVFSLLLYDSHSPKKVSHTKHVIPFLIGSYICYRSIIVSKRYACVCLTRVQLL